jgi:hypothetical protein
MVGPTVQDVARRRKTSQHVVQGEEHAGSEALEKQA